MRFAFKTSPQNTTWADMLALWQAADEIEVYESGWTFDHFYPIFSDSNGADRSRNPIWRPNSSLNRTALLITNTLSPPTDKVPE